ncbi:MAG: hypothetical protein SGI71_04860 [Verrucomicrobiota bacterium]|nr:hypothetical protein [Verrucomicrobiota bacterium]
MNSDEWAIGLSKAFETLLLFAPKVVLAIIVLFAGYHLAKVLARVLAAVLHKLHFEELVEHGAVKTAMVRSGYHVSELVAKILFYGIFLFVLYLAFGIFGPNPVSELLIRIIAFIPSVIVAILIVVIAASIATAVRVLLWVTLANLSYGPALAMIAQVLIVTVGIFAALSQIQIAPEIVNGLFYSVLAIISGSAIVAIGGGGIPVMRKQWSKLSDRVKAESIKLNYECVEEPAPVREPEEVMGQEPSANTT